MLPPNRFKSNIEEYESIYVLARIGKSSNENAQSTHFQGDVGEAWSSGKFYSRLGFRGSSIAYVIFFRRAYLFDVSGRNFEHAIPRFWHHRSKVPRPRSRESPIVHTLRAFMSSRRNRFCSSQRKSSRARHVRLFMQHGAIYIYIYFFFNTPRSEWARWNQSPAYALCAHSIFNYNAAGRLRHIS